MVPNKWQAGGSNFSDSVQSILRFYVEYMLNLHEKLTLYLTAD